MSKKLERGIPGVHNRIMRSQNRLILLINESRLRDLNEIWETYYDVEEAILLSKIIFSGFDRPGKLRKLKVPRDFDFSKSSDSEVRSKLKSVGKNLLLADGKLSLRSGDETIEFLRRARDELKAMLLKPKRARYSSPGTRRKRRRAGI